MEFVLNEYHRNTPDEELIADVKRVAEKLQKESLTQKEYKQHGHYSCRTMTLRFGSWNEVLRRSGLSVEKGRLKLHDYCENDEILFEDVRRVAKELGRNYLTKAEYDKFGKYSNSRLYKFKGWNGLLIAAGLEQTPFRTGPKRTYSSEELFEEMERVWIKLGHQPSAEYFRSKGNTKINAKPYINRFGSWLKALEAFVAYINSDDDREKDSLTESVEAEEPIITTNEGEKAIKHKTHRDINLRLRFRVMARDHFKCCKCGKSPATDPTVILHVDHIYPYSKGGETVMENLRTLCTKCNWGKSDLLIDNG